jgi:hypothetical protein
MSWSEEGPGVIVELIVSGFAALVCCGCAGLLGYQWPAEIVIALGTGWAVFLGDVIVAMTVNWDGVATAALALGGVVVGLHLFLRWLYVQAAPAAETPAAPQETTPVDPGIQAPVPPPQETPRRWRIRWTVSIVAVVVIMFIAGFAVVGLTRQTMWLLSSREPLVIDARDSRNRPAPSPR